MSRKTPSRIPFRLSPDDLREMYFGHRGNKTARRYARLWASVFGLGLTPKRWITLEVPGRRSGRITKFPLGMTDLDGEWFLVSMLGDDCHWVKNVRAAHGQVVLRHRRARRCQLVEVPTDERAPIIKRYVQQVPGARPHIPVETDADVSEFRAVASNYPVFRVTAATSTRGDNSRPHPTEEN